MKFKLKCNFISPIPIPSIKIIVHISALYIAHLYSGIEALMSESQGKLGISWSLIQRDWGQKLLNALMMEVRQEESDVISGWDVVDDSLQKQTDTTENNFMRLHNCSVPTDNLNVGQFSAVAY